MKKLIILIIAGLMLPVTAQVCRADFKDMADTVENTAEFWFGGYFSDQSNSKNTSEAERLGLSEEATRIPGNKAAEYYSLENSPSGGFLYKSVQLPSRYHFEFDFYNVDDWYGDFRYSYLDYVQFRLLSRRFYHNLDTLTLYDWSTAAPGADAVFNLDAGVDDYGLRTDIDQYKLRFKAPNFPIHLYTDGEYILKEGTKQLRYMGGDARNGFGTIVSRYAQSSEVDQEKQEYSLGTNAHLGPIEFDVSRKWRKFESNVVAPTYVYGTNTLGQVHNAVPELEATTDTFKIHTSHSGRLFFSGTYSNLEKTNNSSHAEATNEMGYGEMVWLPAGYISFTAKYRHQKNEAEAPATVSALDGQSAVNTPQVYTVHHGVESTLETASLGMRYSLIPRSNLQLKYTNNSKEVEEQSAIDWSKPLKTTKDIYEVKFSNWAIPRTRITAKFKHTEIDNNFIPFVAGPPLETSVNNEPDRIDQGVLGVAIMATSKVALFLNANVVEEKGNDMREHIDEDWNLNGEALRQTYVASIAYTVSEKLSFSLPYTYMSSEQERDLIWEDNGGNPEVDSEYTNEQIAHNIALNMMSEPTERLSINASIDYTTTEGNYVPKATLVLNPAIDLLEIASISNSETEEINLRLDTGYDLGGGWGVGMDLRFTDWKDESFDNPYDGTYIGGLVKITKTLM